MRPMTAGFVGPANRTSYFVDCFGFGLVVGGVDCCSVVVVGLFLLFGVEEKQTWWSDVSTTV